MTRVYMPDVDPEASRVEVTADEAHHLSRVVRVRVGDTVGVFDGRGREWRAHVTEIARHSVLLVLDAEVAAVVEPPVRVTLAVGLLKGDQMDAVVRDATAMGVSTIVPLITAHVAVASKARPDDRALARWQRVAVAGAKQSQRAVVPTIAPAALVDAVWAAHPCDMTVACMEPAAHGPVAPPWSQAARPGSVLLLVGPEGGWSPDEVVRILAHGGQALSLGPRTLRAELAPAVALATLWSIWGWD